MTRYFRIIFFLAFSFQLAAFSSRAQQSFSFTQYMNNLTPYNSAYSLIGQNTAIDLTGRRQWMGIDGAPTSYLLSMNFPIKNLEASTGLVVLQDKFAVEEQSEANLFFAKAVQVNDQTFLAVSLNGGFRMYKANYSQIDPSDPGFHDDINENGTTAGAGILFYNPQKFYLGASLPRLSIRSLGHASVEKTRNIKNTFYFSGGLVHPLGNAIHIKPVFLVSYSQNIPVIADLSTTFIFGKVGIGLNYRTNKEAAGLLTFLFDNFRMGYSYQAGVVPGTIGSYQSATHELTIGLRFSNSSRSVVNLL